MKRSAHFLLTVGLLLISVMNLFAVETEKWYVILEKPLASDEAEKVVCWQGRVDGCDLFKVKGKEIDIKHLRFDIILESKEEFSTSFPAKDYTVIVKDIQSRTFGPFVLEQPPAKNDYTITLYLLDSPMHGYSWWKFELYYIPKSPEELGLEIPWK